MTCTDRVYRSVHRHRRQYMCSDNKDSRWLYSESHRQNTKEEISKAWHRKKEKSEYVKHLIWGQNLEQENWTTKNVLLQIKVRFLKDNFQEVLMKKQSIWKQQLQHSLHSATWHVALKKICREETVNGFCGSKTGKEDNGTGLLCGSEKCLPYENSAATFDCFTKHQTYSSMYPQ
jgi:hypothetical protein